MYRLLILALLLYVGLDFANPNMPGALNFDPDQSVDAVSTQARGGAPALLVVLPSPVVVATIHVLLHDMPKVPSPPIARTVTWSQRPLALLSSRTSPGSPEAH